MLIRTFSRVVAPESQTAGMAKNRAPLSRVWAGCLRNLLCLVPMAALRQARSAKGMRHLQNLQLIMPRSWERAQQHGGTGGAHSASPRNMKALWNAGCWKVMSLPPSWPTTVMSCMHAGLRVWACKTAGAARTPHAPDTWLPQYSRCLRLCTTALSTCHAGAAVCDQGTPVMSMPPANAAVFSRIAPHSRYVSSHATCGDYLLLSSPQAYHRSAKLDKASHTLLWRGQASRVMQSCMLT